MKDKIQLIHELIEKAESFGKLHLELYKLKAIDKVSEVFASVATGILVAFMSLFLLIFISTGLAMWLGEVLGKAYYGFFAVAGIYLLLIIILFIIRKSIIEIFFNNFMIRLIFKEKDHAKNS